MTEDFSNSFPLSRTRKVRGNRRLAREKAMQVLMAYFYSESSLDKLFSHIFFRDFNFGDREKIEPNKLLSPDEVLEIESDVPIAWRDDDIEFGTLLIRHSLEDKEKIELMIEKYVKGWELDRIAPIDRSLMHIASAEFAHFPEIPTKCTVNEAIDIAKKYSTDRSGTFINGILESILEELKAEGKVEKTGRGLKEDEKKTYKKRKKKI